MTDFAYLDKASGIFIQSVLSQYYNFLDNTKSAQKTKKLLDSSPKNFVVFSAEVAECVYSLSILKTHMYPRRFIKSVSDTVVSAIPEVSMNRTSNCLGEEQCLCLFWASVLRFYANFKTRPDQVSEEQMQELDDYINKLRVTALAYHKTSEKKVRELLAKSELSI